MGGWLRGSRAEPNGSAADARRCLVQVPRGCRAGGLRCASAHISEGDCGAHVRTSLSTSSVRLTIVSAGLSSMIGNSSTRNGYAVLPWRMGGSTAIRRLMSLPPGFGSRKSFWMFLYLQGKQTQGMSRGVFVEPCSRRRGCSPLARAPGTPDQREAHTFHRNSARGSSLLACARISRGPRGGAHKIL